MLLQPEETAFDRHAEAVYWFFEDEVNRRVALKVAHMNSAVWRTVPKAQTSKNLRLRCPASLSAQECNRHAR
jgi:hypothetical protein